jgi:hypothetical protein
VNSEIDCSIAENPERNRGRTQGRIFPSLSDLLPQQQRTQPAMGKDDAEDVAMHDSDEEYKLAVGRGKGRREGTGASAFGAYI